MIKHLYLPLLLLLCFITAARAQTCEPAVGIAEKPLSHLVHDEDATYVAISINAPSVFLNSTIGTAGKGNTMALVAFDNEMRVKWTTKFLYKSADFYIIRYFKFKGEDVLRLHVQTLRSEVDFGDTVLKSVHAANLYELSFDAKTGRYLNAELLLYAKSIPARLGAWSLAMHLEENTESRVVSGIFPFTKIYSGFDNSLIIDSVPNRPTNAEYILMTSDRRQWKSIKVETKGRNKQRNGWNIFLSGNQFAWYVQFSDSMFINDKFVDYNPLVSQISGQAIPIAGILRGNVDGQEPAFFSFQGATRSAAQIQYIKKDGTIRLTLTSLNNPVTVGGIRLPEDPVPYRYTNLDIDPLGKVTVNYQFSSASDSFQVSESIRNKNGLSYLTLADKHDFIFNGELIPAAAGRKNTLGIYSVSSSGEHLRLLGRIKSGNSMPLGILTHASDNAIWIYARFKAEFLVTSAPAIVTTNKDLEYTAFARLCLSDLTGIAQVNGTMAADIAAYPNPISAGGRLQLNGAPAGTQWVLTSAEGRQIPLAAQAGIPAQWLSIPATAAPGLYILSGTSPEGALLRSKIIVR